MNTSHIRSGCCWLPLMKPITAPAGRLFDHLGEALAHDLLKLHALLDDRGATPALEQGLLDPREAAAQDAHDQVVLVVGLCAGRASPVELLEQRDQPVGDGREHIPMRARGVLDDVWGVHR